MVNYYTDRITDAVSKIPVRTSQKNPRSQAHTFLLTLVPCILNSESRQCVFLSKQKRPDGPSQDSREKKTDGPSLVLIVVPVEKCFLANTCWSHTCTLVGGRWSHSVLVFCWKRQHQKTKSSPPIKTSPQKNNPHQKMPKYKDCKWHNDSLP